MSDKGERHIYDAARQTACVHDFAGEHEERHRHERKAVGPVDDVLRDDLRVEDIELIHQRDTADDQRKRDRHAERHGAQQRQREHRDRHAKAPLWLFRFPHCDEVLSAGVAGDHADKVVNQNDAGRDAEHDAGAVEQSDGQVGRGRPVTGGDDGLPQLPASSSQLA